MTLYMAVTADKYELPVRICDTGAELARLEGIKLNTLYCAMLRKRDGSVKGVKYIRVEIDDD